MYKNCGAKVKGLATFFAVLGMIASVIMGIVVMASEETVEGVILGIVVIAVGFICAWLSGLMMAAFGELVQNSYEILQIMKKNNSKPVASNEPVAVTQIPAKGKCPYCGGQNKPDAVFCVVCGSKL